MPRSLVHAFAGFALAACGDSGQRPQRARPYADPGFVTDGDVRLHYALTLTSELPPAIAGSYGIVQRRNLALLLITLAPVGDSSARRLAPAELGAASLNLLGERQPLSLRRVDEAGGPSYLALVAVRHREPITIEIRARAAAGSPEMATRWTREFHLD